MAILWRTTESPEDRGKGEYEITNNIEVSTNGAGSIVIRITRESLREDRIGISKTLTTLEAMRLSSVLLSASMDRGE